MNSCERNPRICIIGAGFAGMGAFIKLKSTLNSLDIDVYELNKDIGGVWYSHTYPGCRCDVPAHVYCFSFDPITDSKSIYSSREGIFKYMQKVAKKNKMHEHTHFEHQVNKLTWNEERMQWVAEISNLANGKDFVTAYDFVITATGLFRNPRIPDEFLKFKGHLVHTALWNSSISLQNKRIAVVGSGASGSQILPELAKVAKKLVLYQRRPYWVIPKFDYEFPKMMYWLMRNIPPVVALYRYIFHLLYETIWRAFHQESWMSKIFTGVCNFLMKKELKGQEELQQAFQPTFDFGCTIISSDEFYKAFLMPHVKLVTSSITEITEKSIVTEDGEEEFDIIICATGFHIKEYFSPMEIITTKGRDLSEKWKDEGPSLFMGVLNHEVPNLFVISGPFGIPVNNIISMIELQVDLVTRCVQNALQRSSRKLTVRKRCEEKYMERIQVSLKKMVWSSATCSTQFADDKGRNITWFPDALRKFRSDVVNFKADQVLEFD